MFHNKRNPPVVCFKNIISVGAEKILIYLSTNTEEAIHVPDPKCKFCQKAVHSLRYWQYVQLQTWPKVGLLIPTI